jgi:hypothetical protein
MHVAQQIITHAVLILTVLNLAACNKPTAEQEPEPEAPVVQSAPPTPAPLPTPAIVSATPEPNYFAPPGVYYLVSPASVETPDGIVGLRPGTKVQKVAPGKYTADGHQLELREVQVTNDLRVAHRVAGADRAAEAALRQAMNAAAEEAAKAAQAKAAATPVPSNVVATGQPPKPAAPRPGLGSSLGSSGALGRTKSQDGWIWQMDANGNWQPLRPDK